MRRRNWLALYRKLVDVTDLDFTVNAVLEYISKTNLAFFGEGVVVTTQYPNPFPVTLDTMDLGGVVGPGVAFDPSGLMARIDSNSTTSPTFTISPADPALPRWDLLVLQYLATGDTLIPSPANPLTNVPLNLHDDFALVVVPGTPSGAPSYPAKGPYDVILGGLRVPPAATNASQVTLDLAIREQAVPQRASNPVYKVEEPTGNIDGNNVTFALSATPLYAQGVKLILDGLTLEPAQYVINGQTVTLTSAPGVGQTLWARYMVSSPASQNPLADKTETPTGNVDGSNPTFVLSGTPGSMSSVEVFIDGLWVDPSLWSLIETSSQSEIQFTLGSIPQKGQDVVVSYLINASTIGASSGSSGGGGGSGGGTTTASGYTVYGMPSNPNIITPAAGILVASTPRQYQYVAGLAGGGPQPITAAPQIAPGSTIGQELTLRGTSAADYPVLVDGNGVSLNGECDLTDKQTLLLTWNGSVWDESSRRI